MNIQERINEIKPYFRKMNVTDGIIYIAVTFPEKWAINEYVSENYNVSVTPIQGGGFYFYTNLENGFDNVFNAIDYTIKFNEQAEEKIKLLITKVEELKEIFNEEDIDVLKTIEFKLKRKRQKKIKDCLEKNVSLEKEETNINNVEKISEEPLNINERTYSEDTLKQGVEKIQTKIKKREMYGECNNPSDSTIETDEK